MIIIYYVSIIMGLVDIGAIWRVDNYFRNSC